MTPTLSLGQGAKIQARIAVVEDDRDQREVVVEFLQDMGYAARGFESAEAFYRHLATNFVDVVVLDIGLPGENGLSVTQHLHTLPDVRIIIVSARVSEAERRAGLAAGAQRYMIKPIILDELAFSIEAELARAAIVRDKSVEATVTAASLNPWSIEKENWQMTAPNGQSMVLSAREFAFVHCLIAADGKTVAQETVASSVYSGKVITRHDRMDVMLSRLRKKCKDCLGIDLPVKTVHLIGYVFTATAQLK
jgi:DNA-binding response OmpR family regulator